MLCEWRERSGAEGAGVLPAWMRRESCVKSGEEWVVLAHYRQQYPGEGGGVSDCADGEGGGGASGVVRRPEPRTGIERRGEEGAALWAAQSGAAGAARVQGGSRAEGGGEVVVDHWWLELREAGGGHLGDRRRRWRSLWRPLS